MSSLIAQNHLLVSICLDLLRFASIAATNSLTSSGKDLEKESGMYRLQGRYPANNASLAER